MSTYTVFLKDGSSYDIPSTNVENTQRLLGASIEMIQPKGAEETQSLEAVVAEPLIKADDYTVKELKDMCIKYGIELPKNAKKAEIVDLLNEYLS
jgi:hypothetical protein